MYQIKDGQVINAMFEPQNIPKGWYDSPDAAKIAVGLPPKNPLLAKAVVEEVKPKRKRRTNAEIKAAKNGDSSRTN